MQVYEKTYLIYEVNSLLNIRNISNYFMQISSNNLKKFDSQQTV